MEGKVKCTCGWSWNKSDSSAKDMYICHQCGRDNSNNMKNGGWLENYNDSQASAPEGMVGDGFSNVGRNYSPAWGGQFQTGGSMPGAVGFTYARTQGIPSEGPYAKKTMSSAQTGKKIKIKDEREQAMKSSESTGVKRKDFDLEQSKENKAYINAVAAQKKEAARRAKLTKEQREREDYNAYNEQHGSINKYTPETTWQRTKAVVSNPMTAAGYIARGENLPGNFQAGPRNAHDYAVDWINPLQGAVALSEIPGELSREEYLNAGLSGLDALDLGVYARGAMKVAKPLMKPIKKTLAKGALKTFEKARDLDILAKDAIRGIDDAIIYPIKYRKQIADIKKLHSALSSELESDEAVKRLSEVLKIDPTNLNYPSITTLPRIGSHYNSMTNNINMDFRQLNQFKTSDEYMLSPNTVYDHEVGHWMQAEAYKNSPDYARELDNYKQELAEYEKQLSLHNSPDNKALENMNHDNATQEELRHWFLNYIPKPYKPRVPFPIAAPTKIDRFAQQLYGYDESKKMINIDKVSNPVDMNLLESNARYFTNRGVEPLAHLREMRQNMLTKDYIKDKYGPISEEIINKFISENPTDRISSFTIPGSNQVKGLVDIFKNLPSVVGPSVIGAGAAGTAAYQMQDEEPLPGMRRGGVIRDDRGQWAHPGEITEINSNEITMGPDPKTGKPLTKPLLGISDTGDVKLMRPGGNYKFDGKKVTEYPIAQDGKTFLDELKANTAAKKNKVNIRETVPTAVNDVIPNASKMAVKADEARNKDIRHSNKVAAEKAQAQRTAQRQFNALPKEEQERILYEQYNRERGTINQYEPDSMLETIGNVAVAPMSALKAKMETGRVPDNLVKGLIENPDQINPYDAAYLGTLGYAAAPYVSQAVAAASPYMAANAVNPITGATLTGVNLNNLITSGFATHGLINVGPNTAEFVEDPSWEKAFDVGMNAVEIFPIAGPATKTMTEGLGYLGNKANQTTSYIGETAPKFRNFMKDAAEDVKGVYNQYKEINKIKNSKSYPKSLSASSKLLDNIKHDYSQKFNSITDPYEFNSILDDLVWDFEQNLIRMGGRDFAGKGIQEWKASLQQKNPKLFLQLKEIGNGTINPTIDDLKQLGKEFSETIPKGEDLIPAAKKHLSNVQKQLLFNKNEDFKVLKEFTKTIGVKTPKVPKVEYTPKERETIDAIRELGKYKRVAQNEKNRLLNDPEAMANINKVILKLDDDVVQNLIGISKSELLNSYKNVVPATKKTQVDITSNPIPVSDLSIVDAENITQQPGVFELDRLNEKIFTRNDPKRESLLQRIEQSYAKNFRPIDYENPNSYPESLIGLAKTDYAYMPVKDAANNIMYDIDGNVIEKLMPQGKTKEQLVRALRKVDASPKGTNFVGSGNLSTDSYPLTLDSGILMSKKGLVDVNVQTGKMYLNDMGYTHMSPKLVIKDINSKIEELEKLSGKKLPRAKYNPNASRYEMYEVPQIYFTRLRQGGSINKADENSLVKLDQLTNFTNYNKPQPGGWLSKYE